MDKKIKYIVIGIAVLIVCWLGFLVVAALNGIYPVPN